MHSFAAKSAIDKTILSNFDNTADRYLKTIYETMIGTNDKFNFTSADDYALKIGFKSVKIDSYNFVFTSMHEFDDPAGLGALAYYQKYAVIAPMGFTTDVENQAAMPMFGYQYRKQGSFSRESVTSMWGGHMATEGTVVNGDDIQHVAVGCHIAFHGYCGNHCAFQHE